MNSNRPTFQMWMGFDVCTEFMRPLRLEFWKGSDFANFKPEAPFHYQADALIGLSLFLLHPSWKGPHLPPHASKLPQDLWKAMEPHHELFNRSQARAQALRTTGKQPSIEKFEKKFTEIVMHSLQNWGLDLTDLHELIGLVDELEDQTKRPLLYNFDLQATAPTLKMLHLLHSLLFNLRTLTAMDYNAYIQDPTHEALKVDSITDYLAHSEIVVNDALLYFQFAKMKDKLPTGAAKQMEHAFGTYSHNGTCLIQSLPESFMKGMKTELEESLYLVQMDWLLGTEAGLLFRIREEIYGLIEGYTQIFWPDADQKRRKNAPNEASKLSIQCELTEKSVQLVTAVA